MRALNQTVYDMFPSIPHTLEHELQGMGLLLFGLFAFFVILFLIGTRHRISGYLVIPAMMICAVFPIHPLLSLFVFR